MEQLSYTYKATQPIKEKIHVGVVGSGDLEILMFQQQMLKQLFKSAQVVTASKKFGEMC
jgi:malonate decarboxylase delta subunit